MRARAAVAVAGCLWILLAVPVAAQVDAGSTDAELYVGYYYPGPGPLENDVTFGFRGGTNVRRNVAVQVGFGYVKTSGETEVDSERVGFDYKLTFLELTAVYQWSGGRKWFLNLEGGPGWSFVDANLGEASADNEFRGLRADTFSMHFGGGGRYFVGETWYVRPTLRFRWQEGRERDGLDSELTVAFGYNFRQ